MRCLVLFCLRALSRTILLFENKAKPFLNSTVQKYYLHKNKRNLWVI